jgi:putative transposase
VTFAFIEDNKGCWPVRLMCETLEVSTTGYYAWRERPPSFAARRRDALVVLIRSVHFRCQGTLR